MGLVFFLSAGMAAGSALLAGLLFLDARRWRDRRSRFMTALMNIGAVLFLAAAAGLVWFALAVLDAMLSIF